MNSRGNDEVNAITLRQLQYFVAVAEEQHFTRASERLLIAQPSLSRHVRDLEDLLGVELFVRDTHGVTLTEAGRELLSRAKTLFAMLERTVDAVRSAAAGQRGRLRLGYYGPAFYNNFATRSAFERFRAESPDVEVISREVFAEQIVPALRQGQIDIGIGRATSRVSDVEFRRIAVETLVALLPESDPLASEPQVSLAKLSGRNLITFQSELAQPLNERIAEIARNANATFTLAQQFTQLSTIVFNVARGEGIALVPKSLAVFPFYGVARCEISDPQATVDLVASTRRGEQSPVVLRFLELLGSLE
jgi:DNA-binding transcriptional LysR family regulator